MNIVVNIIELDDGKIYRKPLYLMVKTMVSCRFSLKTNPLIIVNDMVELIWDNVENPSQND
jgi:hypothetical protein